MTYKGVINYMHEQWDDNSHAVVTLLGEPITLNDGSEYGLFDVRYSPSGNHQVHAVHMGEGYVTQHYFTEEEVLQIGDGNFHVGAMRAAKNYFPEGVI